MERKFADVPEALWKRVQRLIPPDRPKPRGGRPRVPDRVVLAGILYRLQTGCQWKALPNQFGSGSTCHLRFHQWCEAGVFQRLHAELLRYYDKKRGIQWTWAALDTAMVKAPKRGTSRAAIRLIAASAE